jgi:DGQHR domain-containing protein
MANAKKADPNPISFHCLSVKQGATTLALFSAPVAEVWKIVDINRREPDKDKGYQRILSAARVGSIARYVKAGNPIPNSVLIAFDKAEISHDGKILTVPRKHNAGWVIDGQHRLAGIHESGSNIEMSFVAFVNIALERQIEQFVKINKEAKNVPTSLYLDLLKHLPDKSEADQAKERAADIADNLRKDEDSPFFGRISILDGPKPGQLSLTNFVRKISPLVAQNKGKFHVYSVTEQIKIFANYYLALEHAYPDVYEPKEGTSLFFKTLGFGALINALPTVFDLTLKLHKGFKVESIVDLLKRVDDFDFEDWKALGTGSEVENQAGSDFREKLRSRVEEAAGDEGMTLDL